MCTFMKQKNLAPIAVEQELLERKISIFTPQEFQRIFRASPQRTKYFLETYTKKGLFQRLKQGIYALKERFPVTEEIANALYKPSYISFAYALSYHGIIPESVYTITSATTKPTRKFTVRDIAFSYAKIKKQAFTGYSIAVFDSDRSHYVSIATPEKALVDYLYFVSLGKFSLNDRLDLRKLDKKKIMYYAGLFEYPKLTQLVKKVWERKDDEIIIK